MASNTKILMASIIVVVVVVLAIAVFALSKHAASPGTTSTVTGQSSVPSAVSTLYTTSVPPVTQQSYNLSLLSQNSSFSLGNGKGYRISEFMILPNSSNITVTGAYSSYNAIDAYILTAAQYNQTGNSISEYLWYGGYNHGSTINNVSLVSGTYYLIFYYPGPGNDTVTAVKPIDVHFVVTFP